MERKVVIFMGPRLVDVRSQILPDLNPGELLLESELSAISAGTEMLLYRGQIPREAEAFGDSISQGLQYPAPYGYAVVGRVIAVGGAVDDAWLNRRVFAFQPHASHCVVRTSEVVAIPDGVELEDAAFLANVETAVGLVHDAAPLLGESVLVMGQGVVGLLVTGILREFPLSALVTADSLPHRRVASTVMGVGAALDPAAVDFHDHALISSATSGAGYDLTLELTGNPEALDEAIALTRFSGRVVVGSWYGSKPVPLRLGGRYHRSRISLVPSQVTTIAPGLSGRWDKRRRFQTAWSAIGRVRPARWITHRVPVEKAPEAYRLLDQGLEEAIQVILQYKSSV